MLEKLKNVFANKKQSQSDQRSQQPQSSAPDDIFAAMEDEVTDEDMEEQRRQLARADRIGKISKWICMIADVFLGGYIANLKTASPWSKIPFVGQVYDLLFADPLKTFIAMAIGAAIGWGIALLISKGIYSGGVQDERNKRKLQ